jgi:DNA-binding NarL/FixJ family response regulator
MIVDDAASVRSRLTALCEDVPGVERILEADGHTAALALLEAQEPDALILDLHLKGESGLELLSVIKRRRPNMVVIVLTNDASSSARRSCEALGANYFFDKSTEFESILPLLGGMARERRLAAGG